MPSVVWNDRVKAVISEVTRGAQLSIWRNLQDAPEEADIAEYTRDVYTAIMVAACRALSIKVNGEWHPITKGNTVTIPIDEDTSFKLSFPPTVEELNEMPVSFANEWASMAEGVNQYLINLLFFTEKTPNATTTNSEPPSASAS